MAPSAQGLLKLDRYRCGDWIVALQLKSRRTHAMPIDASDTRKAFGTAVIFRPDELATLGPEITKRALGLDLVLDQIEAVKQQYPGE